MSTAAFYSAIAGAGGRFRGLLARARDVQQWQLLDILRHNEATGYGRRHGFGGISSYAQFRGQVPITDYETLRESIARMAAGEADVLVPDMPLAFEETGGSSGGAKLLPYTPQLLAAFRYALLPWLDDLAVAYPQIADGLAYWAISPAARPARKTSGGLDVGLGGDAAFFGEQLAPLVLNTLAVPSGVTVLADVDVWRDATCAHLIACERLALISVWSPTFLDDLLSYLRMHGERLLHQIRAGAYTGIALPPARAAIVLDALRQSAPDYRRLWRNLQVVSCWDQAASRPYAAALRTQLGGIPVQGKGLLATEGVVSIPLQGLPMPVLALESGFFEFRDANGACHDAAELIEGGEYEVLMTTWGGLYRYAIGDRVRVHGYTGEAPLIEFLGRSGVTSDLCGEKLSEDFVIRALQPLGLRFALLAPATGASRGYLLFVDGADVSDSGLADCAALADAALCANPQYAYARRLDQLAAVEIRRCAQPLVTWQRHGVARGMRLGDIKPPALSPHNGWEQRFQVAAP